MAREHDVHDVEHLLEPGVPSQSSPLISLAFKDLSLVLESICPHENHTTSRVGAILH